jgi:hypothetical protein
VVWTFKFAVTKTFPFHPEIRVGLILVGDDVVRRGDKGDEG